MEGPQPAVRKTFVLCFDGTGNKFSGTSADSNILKIYGMLDGSDPNQLGYYQPGIGTYVETKSLSHTTIPARLNSWFQKARASAIGSSFDDHVMGGYRFLMRYYTTGDDIFFFGFSRGAYIARFLAEMLDQVGLLKAGNEEMARFAWKAFAQWQQRREETPKDKEKKKKMLEFLTAFRETFSRPVRRIRFLGLFDTVNSVPRFESAWMQRSKFPYTAKSSALIIRHAVGTDERRAKFRQDLISETKTTGRDRHHHHHRGRRSAKKPNGISSRPKSPEPASAPQNPSTGRFRRPSQALLSVQHDCERSTSPAKSRSRATGQDVVSLKTVSSQTSLDIPPRSVDDVDDEDEAKVQDIEEMWFPGCHADIGGGWELSPGEEVPLSHVPLVWIVREARKAGLRFDNEKLLKMKCCDEGFRNYSMSDTKVHRQGLASVPQLRVTSPGSPEVLKSPVVEKSDYMSTGDASARPAFHQTLHSAATQGRIHDCLLFNNGLPASSVLSWKMMEYLPFRRMDLRPDGSWVSISWPLPKGEVRDIPEGAWIHTSALRRMNANPDYRPGNLIIGGGGRGVRKAEAQHGMGQWDVLKEEGDPIGEVFVRARRPVEQAEKP